MAMQFLSALTTTSTVDFIIWLDTTKTLSDGHTPDPSYVFERSWSLIAPNMSAAEVVTMATAEVKLLAQHRLDEINQPTPAPTSLSISGQTF